MPGDPNALSQDPSWRPHPLSASENFPSFAHSSPLHEPWADGGCRGKLILVVTCFPRAYLEVHQQEQEKLQGQIRESKRNSRLVSEGLARMPWTNALCSCGMEDSARPALDDIRAVFWGDLVQV